MTNGESYQPKSIEELLSVVSNGVEVPGQKKYSENLTESPESPFVFEEPTADEIRQREEQFALRVVFAGAIMAIRNPGIVTLVADVDQTFTEDQGRTIRPAFPFALNLLHGVLGDRLEVGLLPTIPQTAIDKMLPQYFKDVSAKVNPDFAISSHTQELEDPSILQAVEKQDFTTVEAIVDPEIIKGTKEGILKNSWFGSKLIILQRLAHEHPDRSFVFVDDLIWAGVIREDHPQVMGVWVGEEMQNDRPRLGKAQLRKHDQ